MATGSASYELLVGKDRVRTGAVVVRSASKRLDKCHSKTESQYMVSTRRVRVGFAGVVSIWAVVLSGCPADERGAADAAADWQKG